MASARRLCSMRAAVMLLASVELTVAEGRALRGLARASNASDHRRLTHRMGTCQYQCGNDNNGNQASCDSWYTDGYSCDHSRNTRWCDCEGCTYCSNNAPSLSPTPVATGFAYISSSMSYSSAQDYCRAYHVDLASIHSSIENAAVAALCPATAYYGCWIGGSDSASEGTWTWSDSTEWNYENWRSGEPTTSSSSSYDYLIIYSNGGWADSTTTTANYKPFVCSTTTPPGSSSGPDKDKDQEDNTIVLVSIFAALALAAAWGFH